METTKPSKIIAVDFDGTMCANRWPRIGAENKKVTEYLRQQKKQGAKLILWTCRTDKLLAAAIKWCDKRGIIFDTINMNVPETVDRFGSDTRKVYADEYLDDKHNTQFDLPYTNDKHPDMISWAEKEVEIACKRERDDSPEEEWDYGCACYESALRAFRSLCKDGHSGWSIGFAKQILNRLIEGKLLTPVDDVLINSIFHKNLWSKVSREDSEEMVYQCRRMSSLFKHVKTDGSISYTDIHRFACFDVDNENVRFHSSLVDGILDEMFPITMPYRPLNDSNMVSTEKFLVNAKNRCYDTIGILELIQSDGMRKKINRYFKEFNGEFVEIKEFEYRRRKSKKL
ncbi:MAG: hypothetical protein RR475_02375 [Clostridia bacterium]